MNPQAIGLVETKGFICAVEAADIMLKTAKVKLVSKKTSGENTTIIIQGEAAAVKAATEAGKAAAGRLGKVISSLIIPNPNSELNFNL